MPLHCLRVRRTYLRILSWLIALLLGLAAPVHASPVLYGSAYIGPDGPSSLYRIDPSSGVAALIGPIGFNRVGAMDFDSFGTLFGVGTRNGDDRVVLLTINTATGMGTEVGALYLDVVAKTVNDLSFRNVDDRLFAIAAGILCVIDPNTGHATIIGDTGSFNLGNGLEFSLNDTLYTVDNLTARILNQLTGEATLVTDMHYPNPPLDFAPRTAAMDLDNRTGILWASVVNGGTYLGETVPLTNHLVTIDVTTGNVTYVGATIRGLDAIAVVQVPEPTILALMLIASLSAIVGRRLPARPEKSL